MKKNKRWGLIFLISSNIFLFGIALSVFVSSDLYERAMIKIGYGGTSSPYSEQIIDAWNHSLEGFACEVVFFGDSMMYRGEWQKYFPDYQICNLAVPGDTVEGCLQRVPLVGAVTPKKVFLLVGVNNLSRVRYEDTIENQYKELIDELQQLGCTIYVVSILPVCPPSIVNNEKVLNANRIIFNICKENEVFYIDLHDFFADEHGELQTKFTEDGVHLNKDGYLLLSGLLEKYIKEQV